MGEDLEPGLLQISGKMLQKKTVRKMLPSYTDAQLQEVDDEIDDAIENPEPELNGYDPFDELKIGDQKNNQDDQAEDEEE